MTRKEITMFKKAFAVTLTVIVALLTPFFRSSAQSSVTPSTISVTGDAEVRVVPDQVILILGVETSDKDLMTAKSQNDERIKKLLALTSRYEIKPEHVQTDYINIEPRYTDSYSQREFIGFFVRKTVVITLKDTSKFEDVLTGALQEGANYVHGIEFRTTELRKHRDAARALAINAAREKATALAGELGRKVSNPLDIRESSFGWWSSYGSWWGSRWSGGIAQNVMQNAGSGSAPSGDSTIALGQITVSAQVSVTFALEPESK
jgi:uncharacterized protein